MSLGYDKSILESLEFNLNFSIMYEFSRAIFQGFVRFLPHQLFYKNSNLLISPISGSLFHIISQLFGFSRTQGIQPTSLIVLYF